MLSTRLPGLALLAAVLCPAATTVATVGDSFADSFFWGLRARPNLLQQNDIQLVRWSRPTIGLSRTDQFDYTGWLQSSADLGTADFCIVQVGTNDMQSMSAGPGKWIRFPTDPWKDAYAARVRGIVAALRANRCRRIIWALQPGFERHRYLSRYQELINQLQVSGVGSDSALVIEIDARAPDYGADGIHFTAPFTLKLADAVFRTVASWRERMPASCFACHTSVKMKPGVEARELLPLRVHPGSGFAESAVLIQVKAPPQSVDPPRVKRAPVRRAAVSEAVAVPAAHRVVRRRSLQ